MNISPRLLKWFASSFIASCLKPKYDRFGNLRHKYGNGIVGADIGTQTVAYNISPRLLKWFASSFIASCLFIAFILHRSECFVFSFYGNGIVGADIGTQTVAYTSDTEIRLKNLSERGNSIQKSERLERLYLGDTFYPTVSF